MRRLLWRAFLTRDSKKYFEQRTDTDCLFFFLPVVRGSVCFKGTCWFFSNYTAVMRAPRKPESHTLSTEITPAWLQGTLVYNLTGDSMVYSVKGPATKWTKGVLFPARNTSASESYPTSLDVERMESQGAHPPSSNAWNYMSTFSVYHCLVLNCARASVLLLLLLLILRINGNLCLQNLE